MPNVTVGGVISSGFRAINVFCLAHKKYLLGIHCNTTYLWVILYKSGSPENHWLLLQMRTLRHVTCWGP